MRVDHERADSGRQTPRLSRRARTALRPFHSTTLFAVLAGLPMLLTSPAAYAQDESPEAAQEADDAAAAAEGDAPITVTGTRISGFTAPTPVTVIGEAELEEKAVSTVADLLEDVPQLRINQNIGKSSEPVGASNADLRGLGSQRTLVLLDSRRIAFTDPAGTIDTNIVPVALISNVEIVTGGASAAYGSDAVAGVVNFVLDKKLEGLKLDVSYGQSIYDDHRRPAVSAAFGTGLFDDRLRITVAGDYMHNSGQTAQGERRWGANETAQLTNPAYTPTNGQPRLLLIDNSRFSQMTSGSVLTRTNGLAIAQRLGFAAGTGVQFDRNGVPIPFAYGTNIGGTFMTGGDGGSVSDEGNILPEIERMTGYAGLTFEVADNVSFFADALYSRVEVLSDLGPNPDNGGLTIRNDNAFLHNSVKTAMGLAGLTTITIGRLNSEDGNGTFENTTEVRRFTFGLEGSFGDWEWDVSGQVGRNDYESLSHNNRLSTRWTNGLDAVINPATGQPICRALLTNPTPTEAQDPFRDIRDCVPINPFGAGSVSNAALAYYRGTSFTRSRQEQDVFAANLSGKPFATWAGPVGLAVGAEYRREKTILTADADSALRRWRSINAQPFSGAFDVKEAYAEVVVPLASGSPMAENLEVNGALRYTDYSLSGGVTTWKIGLNYSPVADLRFRGTLSRDIRAPNNFELFSRGNQVISAIIDPRDNTSRQTVQITSGNSALTPEKADTFTAGVVFQPGWLSGFRASVDYYTITINQAVSTVTPQNIVDFCHAGRTEFCAGVVRDAANIITRVNVIPFNADSLETAGIDVEAQYRFGLFGPGEMSLRGLVNYVDKLVVTANGVSNDYVGLAGISPPPQGIPQWRVNLDANYSVGGFRVGVSYRYIDGGKYDTRFNTVVLDLADNTIAGRSYVDVSASYKLTGNFEIYGRVDNLFDVDPPISPNGIVQPTIANSQFFDRRGTFWVVGGRLRL